MNQKASFSDDEVRVIKINRATILKLINKILYSIGNEIFWLSSDTKKNCVTFDTVLDDFTDEVILLAYHSNGLITKEAFTEIKQCITIRETKSLFTNKKARKYDKFHIRNGVTIKTYRHKKRTVSRSFLTDLPKVFSVFSIHSTLMKENELRAIRLTQDAVYELLWEHFMECGYHMMDISEEDSSNIIFHMNTDIKLTSLVFYAIKISSFPCIKRHDLDTYFLTKLPCSTNSLTHKDSLSKPLYLTVQIMK